MAEICLPDQRGAIENQRSLRALLHKRMQRILPSAWRNRTFNSPDCCLIAASKIWRALAASLRCRSFSRRHLGFQQVLRPIAEKIFDTVADRQDVPLFDSAEGENLLPAQSPFLVRAPFRVMECVLSREARKLSWPHYLMIRKYRCLSVGRKNR